MLTQIEVSNDEPFYLKLQGAKPTDSIIVEKIEGLDPPAVTLFTGEYARDGGYYNGRRVDKRNVVLTLQLNPNYALGETVSGLRELLYKVFLDPNNASDYVNIVLSDDEKPDRYVTGYVEKFESDLFSVETLVQISLICPNPFIINTIDESYSGAGPAIPFVYTGSADTGVEIFVTMTTASTALNFSLNEIDILTLNYAFQAGDMVYVNTKKGSKKIQVTRAGATTDILYAMSVGSKWLEVRSPNNNILAYGVPTGMTPHPVVATINTFKFRPMWWGV